MISNNITFEKSNEPNTGFIDILNSTVRQNATGSTYCRNHSFDFIFSRGINEIGDVSDH